jgi:hypothetical protein
VDEPSYGLIRAFGPVYDGSPMEERLADILPPTARYRIESRAQR